MMNRFIKYPVVIAALLLPNMTQALSAAEAFADTPENHNIVEQSYAAYQRISKEHGKFIDVNGIQMHYLEWGDETGIPLIWSHGYTSSGYELAGVAEGLVKAGYHVYAITYRGHGQTQVRDYNFSLDTIADDIAAMMDKLGIDKAVIGGLSLGGGVTTAFYDHYPERALAIVLEDGGADAVQARSEKMYPIMKKLIDDNPAPPEPVFDTRFSAFQYVANIYVPGWGGKIPEGIAPAFHSWIMKNDAGKFVPHYKDAKLLDFTNPAANDPSAGYKLPLLAQSWRRVNPFITYRNLSVPMVIINPTGDMFDPSDDFEALRAQHPSLITVIDYPDTPHAAHPMRPNWFIRDLTALKQKFIK
ncbi:alpha/beta hydrolase [Kordiimonas pumila]|uniref:Alpha/beta hydrolase n=1 Tax=Kordiimonas pumila TaxID=2161677 RepID=A0ABV7D0S0_9PROT|nr:alpha/beta hydrolase [Kordiimonas pumila]